MTRTYPKTVFSRIAATSRERASIAEGSVSFSKTGRWRSRLVRGLGMGSRVSRRPDRFSGLALFLLFLTQLPGLTAPAHAQSCEGAFAQNELSVRGDISDSFAICRPCGPYRIQAIDVSNASPGAVVSCITIHYEIFHTCPIWDLDIELRSSTGNTYILQTAACGFVCGAILQSVTVAGISQFNGEDVNQSWSLYVRDCATLDVGYISSWWIQVYSDDCTAIDDVQVETGPGDTICRGDERPIQWNSTAGAVQIDLLRDGTLCETLVENLPNTGGYVWSGIDPDCDDGSYQVRVSCAGDPSVNAVSAPFSICGISIAEQPEGGTACLPDGHDLCVSAESSCALTYQWRRNGIDVSGADSSCYTTDEPGTYVCAVSSVCGTATSAAALVTRQGVVLRVLHPGLRGRGPGPDFRHAIVATPAGALLRGDVELHVRAGDFYAHGHGGDPRYNQVCLHVVFEDDAGEDTRLANGR
ncbi:MAG: DUF2851 family protein, partial [Planctomycetes bacterium]|nr:DUF2851 family protein [Planctomycetota bacterium]